jgi:hypothetical protein
MRVMSLRRLVRRQRGVSYSLSFVLVVPLYLTIMVFTLEVGILMITRIGLQYAAHMAARSAVVWQSAEPESLRDDRIKLAAVQAIAPYVGGRQREVDDAGSISGDAYQHASDFASAVRRYQQKAVSAEPGLRRPYTRSRTPPKADFLERKFLSAWGRTDVEVKASAQDPRGPLEVTVKLRAPLYMPIVSRFLDPDLSAPFEYPMQTTVTLPNDAPVSKDNKLGIKYQSYRD